jgi:acyl-CoA thioester hydrolase
MAPELMSEQQLGFADVKHVVEYKAEMRAGAAIKGEGRIVEIGNSSIRHEHRLLDANSGELAATYDVIGVLFDLAARRACPLPDNMRAKAEAAIKAGAGD